MFFGARTALGFPTFTSALGSAAGRKRYLDYLAVLEQVVKDAAAAMGNDGAAELRPKLQTG